MEGSEAKIYSFSPYSHPKSGFYRYRFHTRVWKSTLFLENCCFWYPKWCHLIHPSVLKNNPNSYRLSRTFTATAQLPKFCQPDFSILFFKLRTSVPDRSYEHQFRELKKVIAMTSGTFGLEKSEVLCALFTSFWQILLCQVCWIRQSTIRILSIFGTSKLLITNSS